MKRVLIFCGGATLYVVLSFFVSALLDPWSAPPKRSPKQSPHPDLVSHHTGSVESSESGLSSSCERGAATPTSDYQFSQPYTHRNLTVYFICGPETLPSTPILTLDEALEMEVAVVREGSQRGIENLSSGEEIYVQAGDIIKGGTQDRAIRYDAMITPLAQLVPLDVWCVESGRSAPRGREPSERFSRSQFWLGTSDLRRAACSVRAEQGDVWKAVGQTQDQLARKCKGSVRADVSQSSLQLTLESRPVRNAVEPYSSALGSVVLKEEAAIGYVAIINGRAVLGDVYASCHLFRKLWPKLLDGVAVEAVINARPSQPRESDEEEARDFLFDPEYAKPYGALTPNRIHAQEWRTDRVILLEYWDRYRDNLVLHRSFIAR